MTFSHWLRSRQATCGHASARKAGRTRKASHGRQLFLERLEERTVPSIFWVTNTLDSGPGSLRQAIVDANASSGTVTNPDQIQFNLSASDPNHFYYRDDGVAGHVSLANIAATTATDDNTISDIDPDWKHSWWSIQAAAALPTLLDVAVIDGYSQAGASPNTLAVGDNAVLRIQLNTSDNVLFQDRNGAPSLGNYVTIRGFDIAGFGNIGIGLSNCTGSILEGNFIGTDVTGTQASGAHNGTVSGVFLGVGASNNTIGGTTAAARNVISGIPDTGIFFGPFGVNGALPANNVVEGNYIGTDASGTYTLGNAFGVQLAGAVNNTINGNVIAASYGRAGLGFENFSGPDLATSGNVVRGNFIGTDATGTHSIDPNGHSLGNSVGVAVDNGVGESGASGNVIGGEAAGQGNVIAGNNGDGVLVRNSTGNAIRGNSIHDNTGLGIDLGGDGVTLNDSANHTGPNNFQDFPILTSAVTNKGGNTTIAGSFNSPSQPNTSITVDFYANASPAHLFTDGHYYGEGQIYLGSLTFTTNASGAYTIRSFKPSVTVPVGYYITATATDPAGNTSEFGPDVQAVAPGKSGAHGLLVDSSDTSGSGGTGGALVAEALGVYVDNSAGTFSSDALERVEEALAGVNAVVGPYGASLTEVDSGATADVTIQMGNTTALGGQADGVLGVEDNLGITLVQGWNWYAGADGTQIGSCQYDFETVLVHELGHALGLGHSADSTSTMYATLNIGTVNRSLTIADLNVADSDTSGACGLHAAIAVGRVSDPSLTPVGRFGDPSTNDGRDLLFALAGTDELPLDSRQLPGSSGQANRAGDSIAALPNGMVSDAAFAHPRNNLGAEPSSTIFAGLVQRDDDDPLFDVRLLPAPRQDDRSEGFKQGGSNAHLADPGTDTIAADLIFLDY